MKVVTVRSFRDHATELLRSGDILLVTRDGQPAGFFVPWDNPELPVDLRRDAFAAVSERIGEQRAAQGVTEEKVLADFAAARRDRRRR
ncbi:MAG: hypothetical protein NVS3B18_05830 [Candidatus Dormibacteria bacterium]